MITIKSTYEGEAFPKSTLSTGLLWGGEPNSRKFRGIYFKINLPWKKEKEYLDPRTFEPATDICKHTYIFQIVKIGYQWKRLTFLKADVWVPVVTD